MISVSEAKAIIQANVQPLPPVIVPLQQAFGLVLASDVYASFDIPAFRQSAMDGYAFSFADVISGQKLKIAGEVPAGVHRSFNDLSRKAVRIFTGAPVPDGADTVVMQEKVTVEEDGILILDQQLEKGTNVRPKGAEIKAGELGLAAGTFLFPAAIGFLAGIGLSQVEVFPKPSVTILVTGKELQQPGKSLQPGQVYESNSLTIKAALHQLNITDAEAVHVDDDIDLLHAALSDALQKSDLVLLTGGVSVGDYDFVIQAAQLAGVEQLFHKIKQRPGKPLFFGKKDTKLVFGLPGNPSSVLTCFYQYVIPAIERFTKRPAVIKVDRLPITTNYFKKSGLTQFLKARSNGIGVTPLDAQESYRLSSFATANCLIVLPEEMEEFRENDLVEVHFLPL
ncbi:MAG TPA: gephyrin-like molybdotransferase Glp [Segetibacter sp.]|jgi:molybdopterin molybdotransferase